MNEKYLTKKTNSEGVNEKNLIKKKKQWAFQLTLGGVIVSLIMVMGWEEEEKVDVILDGWRKQKIPETDKNAQASPRGIGQRLHQAARWTIPTQIQNRQWPHVRRRGAGQHV